MPENTKNPQKLQLSSIMVALSPNASILEFLSFYTKPDPPTADQLDTQSFVKQQTDSFTHSEFFTLFAVALNILFDRGKIIPESNFQHVLNVFADTLYDFKLIKEYLSIPLLKTHVHPSIWIKDNNPRSFRCIDFPSTNTIPLSSLTLESDISSSECIFISDIGKNKSLDAFCKKFRSNDISCSWISISQFIAFISQIQDFNWEHITIFVETHLLSLIFDIIPFHPTTRIISVPPSLPTLQSSIPFIPIDPENGKLNIFPNVIFLVEKQSWQDDTLPVSKNLFLSIGALTYASRSLRQYSIVHDIDSLEILLKKQKHTHPYHIYHSLYLQPPNTHHFPFMCVELDYLFRHLPSNYRFYSQSWDTFVDKYSTTKDIGVVVLHTVWSFYEKSFTWWKDYLKSMKTKFPTTHFINSLDLFEFAMRKDTYLKFFSHKNLPVIPTAIPSISSAGNLEFEMITKHDPFYLNQPLDTKFVLKPTMGGSGTGCQLLTMDNIKNHIESHTSSDPLIFQPFVPSIQTFGELTFLFFKTNDDQEQNTPKFGYALHKVVAENEWLAQYHTGMKLKVYNPTTEEIQHAASFLSHLEQDWAYARIDFFKYGGKLALSELEAIEPWFFIDLYPSNSTWANVLKSHCSYS